ncbi:hypothetical protein MTO96_051330 [Rhipicephalus appendiculatus]
MASFSMAASPLPPPLDPTQALPAGYDILRMVANARSNLMLLYGAVAQALASVELRRWIDACLNILMRKDWIQQVQSWPIFLLLTPVLLSILSQRYSIFLKY